MGGRLFEDVYKEVPLIGSWKFMPIRWRGRLGGQGRLRMVFCALEMLALEDNALFAAG